MAVKGKVMTSQWHRIWDDGRPGFHRSEVHPDLIAHRARFLDGEHHRVLVPLCGKSVDMAWLAQQGHQVLGVELVRSAVEAFFDEQGQRPTVVEHAGAAVYTSGLVSILVGDFFQIDAETFGRFDRVWDRAALVALPQQERQQYAMRIRALADPGALLLQNAFEYDQQVMGGPPYSVDAHEIRTLYGERSCTLLDEHDGIDSLPHLRARGHHYWRVGTYLIELAR